jgi:5'-3' exonuclease
MGVQGLSWFLHTLKHGKLINKVSELSYLTGKRLAIDAPHFIYESAKQDLQNNVNNIIFYANEMVRHNIQPIFVFDGNTVDFKKIEIQQRVAKNKENIKKIQVLQENAIKVTDGIEKKSEELKTLHEQVKNTTSQSERLHIILQASEIEKTIENETKNLEKIKHDITKIDSLIPKANYKHVKQVRAVLLENGFIVQDAKNDAEKLCANLCLNNEADVVVTNDSDALAFGAPFVFYNILNMKKAFYYSRNQIFKNIGTTKWTQNMFIDFCLLIGNDFLKADKVVPITLARELINKYKSIENITLAPEFEQFTVHRSDQYLEQLQLVRRYYSDPDYTGPEKIKKISVPSVMQDHIC